MDFSAAAAYNPNKEQTRPYVQFELRAMEDRSKSSSDGVNQLIDVAWAVVRAPGAKDSVEKIASEWLAQLKTYARDGRVPPNWPAEYQNAFDLWSKGEEIPVHGTPIKTWPPLTPAMRKSILAVGILTVEDLATANDEMRGKVGMGGHAAQNMAIQWLRESKDAGATARELKNAMIAIEELKRTVAEQATALKALNEPKKV